MTKLPWALLACLLLSCSGPTGSLSGVPIPVSQAADRITKGQVSKVEFYYLPERVFTRAALTPDSLVRVAPYRASIGQGHVPDKKLERMRNALLSSAYKATSKTGDIRLGVQFYNGSDHMIASIFIDQSGDLAIVNGSTFIITGPLRDTIRGEIACLAQ